MAHKTDQACSLYIEQEIQAGLKDGKTPGKVAKEVKAAILKLFQADLAESGLKSRAQKAQKKIGPKSPNLKKSTVKSEASKKPVEPHGGARKGSGRKAKIDIPDLVEPTDMQLDEVDMLKGYYDIDIAERCSKPVPADMDFTTALRVFEIPGCIGVSARVVKAIYIMLSKVHHPDTPGGNADRMMELNVARAVIRKFIKDE